MNFAMLTETVSFLILIFGPLDIAGNGQYSQKTISEIVSSVQKIFNSGCVYLLYSTAETHSNAWIIQLEKLMSMRQLPVTSARYTSIDLNSGKFKCAGNSPLYAFISSDNETKMALETVYEGTFTTAAWILFLDNRYLLEEFLPKIRAPFNSLFLVAHQKGSHIFLTETYCMNATSPQYTYAFGNWSTTYGFQYCGLQYFQRRNNLHGIVLKAAYKYGDHVSEQDLDDVNADRSNGVKVYFCKIWLLLEKLLNFTTHYVKPPDNSWGALANGSWSGMIGMVVRKEVDVALDGFLITAARVNVISFMTPLLAVRSRPFIKKPSTMEHKWTDFLDPFSKKLWIALVITMVLLAGFLSTLHRVGLYFCGIMENRSLKYGFGECLFYVFGSFCQQGHSTTPSSSSCRVVYITSYLNGVILLAAYSAALISYLTVQRLVLPFKTFKGLLEDGTYKFAVLDRSAQLNYFDTVQAGIIKDVYTKLILPEKNNLPLTEAEGLRRICDEHKYAFMTPFDTPLSRYSKLKCEMLEIPDASFPGSLTMPVYKYHPYLGIFNYALENMRLTGILNRLYKYSWPRRPENIMNNWVSVSMAEVLPMLTLLLFGISLSVLVVTIEYLCKHSNIRETHSKVARNPKNKLFHNIRLKSRGLNFKSSYAKRITSYPTYE